MANKHMIAGLLLLTGSSLAGCATTSGLDAVPVHDGTDAVVWVQASPEYAAVTSSIYASALARLQEIARSRPGGARSMAIVLDVDETVLDNSPYQVQLLLDKAVYDSVSWDAWVAQRAADAVPGAVDFIRASQSMGFHVAFVTNRTCRERPDAASVCPQMADTRANLESVGVDTAATTLLLRGGRATARCRALLSEAEQADGAWSSDKTSRRQCVQLDHDIVMLFGDQLGDFVELHENAVGIRGRDVAARYADKWGTAWFMLPNPTYGGWRPRTAEQKRVLLRAVE